MPKRAARSPRKRRAIPKKPALARARSRRPVGVPGKPGPDAAVLEVATRTRTPSRADHPPFSAQVEKFIGLAKKKYLWLTVIVLFVVFSAVTKQSGLGLVTTRVTGEINPDEMDRVHHLNQMVLEAFLKNDFSVLKQMVMKGEESSFEKVPQEYWKVKWFFDLKPLFNVFKEYRLGAFKVGRFLQNIPSGTDPAFSYQVALVQPDVYVSMLLSNEIHHQKFMMNFTYQKVDGEWKLWRLGMGPYEVGGKAAPAWADQAQELHDQGMDAAAQMSLDAVNLCAQPDEAFQYTDEGKWKELATEVRKAVEDKYKLPMALEDVPGKPVVFSLNMGLTTQGPTVIVRYKTQLKLDQVRQVEAEARAMKPSLDRLFSGFEKGAASLDMMAYENSPLTDPKGYGTVIALDQ